MTLLDVDLENLCAHAHHLGDHAVLYNNAGRNRDSTKPIQWKAIDEILLLNNIQLVDLPTEIEQVDSVIRTA